jgi:flagellar assembly protein FliH
MTGTAKPFLFDDDFGERRAGSSRRASDVEALQAAADQAYARGLAEGRRQAEEEASIRLAATLEQVAQAATRALGLLDGEARRLEEDCASLAAAFARKLAGTLVDRQPLGPMAGAASECFNHLTGQPHIAIRVPHDLVDDAKTMLDRIAMERGLRGRLVVLGDPEVTRGDFSIEWAEGGIRRRGAEVDAMIAQAIQRHCGPGST